MSATLELPDKVAMTVPEFAQALGISREHAYRSVQSGKIPSFRVGGRVLVPMHWVRELLEGSHTPPNEGDPSEQGNASRGRGHRRSCADA